VIKLTCLVKRNPSLTADEFAEHWRTTHADLMRSLDPRYVKRYVQRVPFQMPGLPGEYDGVAEQWFDSLEDFLAMIADPDYLARVRPDEEYLLDMSAIVCVLTEDARVVVDGVAD
jgi:uncharacterized protein (TIGR02118 family)